MNNLYSLLSSLTDPRSAEHILSDFDKYTEFLLEKNELFNLTAITDRDEIELKHFIDSLAAVRFVEGSVIDIGSGAGFPSVPLKLVLRKNEFTLVDSLNKRVEFLNELVSLLKLDGIKAIHSRAEDLDKSVKYDTAVARAVSNLATLSEYCLPFVKKGGKFIAYKSDDCDDEIKSAEYAIKILGGKIESIEEVTLFGSVLKRKLVIIRKISDTPPKYPRGMNKPRKAPLLP